VLGIPKKVQDMSKMFRARGQKFQQEGEQGEVALVADVMRFICVFAESAQSQQVL